jgi:hypothetical protein
MNQKQRWEKYNKTRLGVISRIYRGQCSTSKRRCHSQPSYSFDDLKLYLLANASFNKLYETWVIMDYNKWFKPSLDRVNDSKGYSFDNIQLMTWRENHLKANKSCSNKEFKHGGGGAKQVSQFSKNKELIAVFKSAVEANLKTEVNIGNLNMCCNGNRKTAGGFIWKFSNEKDILSRNLA